MMKKERKIKKKDTRTKEPVNIWVFRCFQVNMCAHVYPYSRNPKIDSYNISKSINKKASILAKK